MINWQLNLCESLRVPSLHEKKLIFPAKRRREKPRTVPELIIRAGKRQRRLICSGGKRNRTPTAGAGVRDDIFESGPETPLSSLAPWKWPHCLLGVHSAYGLKAVLRHLLCMKADTPPFLLDPKLELGFSSSVTGLPGGERPALTARC